MILIEPRNGAKLTMIVDIVNSEREDLLRRLLLGVRQDVPWWER